LDARETLAQRKTLLAGVIYFNDRKQTVNCIVRELSAKHAVLICQANSIPTNIIELSIPSRNELYPAAIQNRKVDELYVTLTGASSDRNPSLSEGETSEILRRLSVLETQVRKLQNVIENIKAGKVSLFE
jgi:hypothetical protein